MQQQLKVLQDQLAQQGQELPGSAGPDSSAFLMVVFPPPLAAIPPPIGALPKTAVAPVRLRIKKNAAGALPIGGKRLASLDGMKPMGIKVPPGEGLTGAEENQGPSWEVGDPSIFAAKPKSASKSAARRVPPAEP